VNDSGVSSEQRNRKSVLAVNLGLAVNIFLSVIKTSVGILGNSPALLADGINSTSDVAYNVVVAIFMRLARKPADDTHPYGHSQLESIASLVIGSFVITTAIAIFWNAVNNVFDLLIGEITFEGAELIALWIALLTVVIKLGLAVFTRRIGEQTHNPAVLSLAYDHRNDVFSAAGAAMGIFLGRQGYPWVDPLVGAIVALLVLRTGVEILRQSSAELMDAVPSQALARRIAGLLEEVPGVQTIEEVHAHRFGPYIVVNLTIGVDGQLNVAEGDRIASQVEQIVVEGIDLVRHVYVHYHPVPDGLNPGESYREMPVLHCRLE
jgi:cation diffusion facilitator family transporter